MISAIQAVYEVTYSHLNNASSLWGTRVQPLAVAGASLVKPYVVFFEASNQRRLSTPSAKMAEILLSIKGVTNVFGDALTMQQLITERMDDSGDQDINPRLPYNVGWRILTVTEQRSIWLEEKFSGALDIYHAGHQYLIVMERR